jgi:hypothetical protein
LLSSQQFFTYAGWLKPSSAKEYVMLQKLIAPVALAFGLFMTPANAAPLTGAADGFKAETADATALEKVSRRCWRHRGHLHCRRVGRYYDDSYGYSTYGYGPSIGLYFGGGHRGHRGHRGHGHRR